jgi:hypothetical protein
MSLIAWLILQPMCPGQNREVSPKGGDLVARDSTGGSIQLPLAPVLGVSLRTLDIGELGKAGPRSFPFADEEMLSSAISAMQKSRAMP